MSSSVTPLCDRCMFPLRRGVIPIIWPGTAKRAAFCSVECAIEAGAPVHPAQAGKIRKAIDAAS